MKWLITLLKRLTTWGWRLFMAWLLLLVIAIAGVRLFVGFLPQFHEHVVAYLNDTLNTSFVVEQMEAQWNRGNPTLVLKDLRLQGKASEEAALTVKRLDVELNLRNSLFRLAPVFSYLEADGVTVALESDSDGAWFLKGIQTIRDDSSDFKLERLLDWLQMQHYVDLTNLKVDLNLYERPPASITTRYFSISEESGLKNLQLGLETESGFLELSALGQGYNRRTMAWTGALKVSHLDLAEWCQLSKACEGSLSKAPLNADLQWGYGNNQWYLKGQAGLSSVQYQVNGQASPETSIKSDVFLTSEYLLNASNWSLWLNQLQVSMPDQPALSINAWLNGTRKNETVMTLGVDSIDLAPVKQLLSTSPVMAELGQGLGKELVDDLNLRGHLNEVVIRYFPERELRDALDISASLDKVAVDAWENAPSAANVTGQLRMGALDGYLDLETEDFYLGLTRVFRDVWHFDDAKARLYWDVLEEDNIYRLRSDNIKVNGPEGKLNGKLRLDIPLQAGTAVTMALNVGMKDGDARYASKYLPARLPAMSEELVSWLDNSIKGASIEEGGFIYNGSLSPTSTNRYDSSWGLFFEAEDIWFDYDPELKKAQTSSRKKWPEVKDGKARIWVDNDNVKVLAESGRVLGATVTDVTAKIPLTREPVLELQGQLEGSGHDALHILTETPVSELLQGITEDWDITGDLTGNLSLALPLKNIQEGEVDVQVETLNGRFAMKSAGVVIDDIQGEIGFNTETGLNSELLEGRFLGGDVRAIISSTVTESEFISRFDWEGDISSDALQEWLQIDALSFLEGNGRYKGRLTVGDKQAPVQIKVNSDFDGMEVELPEPLKITPEQRVPMDLTFNIYQDWEELNIKLGDKGKARIRFKDQFNFDSAAVLLGNEGEIPSLKADRIDIGGHIAELDLQPWKQRFAGQPGDKDELNLVKLIEVSDLTIDKLQLEGRELDNVRFKLMPEAAGVRLALNSKQISGSLMLPDDANAPYKLTMKTLHLPDIEQEGEESIDDVLGHIDPTNLPDADISIESLRLGDQDFGSVAFSLRSMPLGKQIQGVKIKIHDMTLTGNMEWVLSEGQHKSTFKGALSGSDIQKVQESLGTEAFVTAEKSSFNGHFSWNGSPLGMDLDSLSGQLALKLKDGNLRKLEGGAGALKLFGILNLETLTRRLRLDFSDLYSKGISFDDLEGAVKLRSGVVTFDEPLVIKGPSSDFKMDGTVNMVKETMDMSLVVTLPVTSNLPVLSVLLGTAPQVAGIIYIADKLVGNQVDQLASIRYHIAGSFDDPEVSLDQLFSSKAKKSSSKKSRKSKKNKQP